MSASEVIEQIKALPPEDKAVVVDFIHQLEAEEIPAAKSIRYASTEQSKAAGDKVVAQYDTVFRKLAH